MGRIFETRKATMFARWDKMSKAFTRIGKEITIAVKAGGPNPDGNPALRRVIQNARAVNMPKDKVEAAIKRAAGRAEADFEEILYEGYAPHGVAILVECATDNPTRTVANVRSHFTKNGGNLASTGSVSFASSAWACSACIRRASITRRWSSNSSITGWRRWARASARRASRRSSSAARSPTSVTCRRRSRSGKITPISAESEYIPQNPMELPEDQATEVLKLIDKLEQDDDVQKVFHNLR